MYLCVVLIMKWFFRYKVGNIIGKYIYLVGLYFKIKCGMIQESDIHNSVKPQRTYDS